MNLISKILLVATPLVLSQMAIAAPPTIMIVPDKTWCIEKGYVTKSTRNGKEVINEDYDKALVDKDFKNVSTAISQVFAEHNFPLVGAAAQNEADDDDEMYDEAFEGAESGSGAQTDAYDQLLMRAKPDILIKLGWNTNTSGSLYSADFTLTGVDSYSNKEIAPLAGNTGEMRRTVPIGTAMKQAAKNNMDDFLNKLQMYFDDLQKNGREIRLDVRIVDNGAGTTMSKEYGGKELKDIIYEWVSDNTVNHQFTQRAGGRNMARYSQVRIPFFDTDGRPMDGSRWVNGLRDKLKSIGLPAEDKSTGLGAARIYIGEK